MCGFALGRFIIIAKGVMDSYIYCRRGDYRYTGLGWPECEREGYDYPGPGVATFFAAALPLAGNDARCFSPLAHWSQCGRYRFRHLRRRHAKLPY